jgi:hypothetical protein
MGYARSRSRLGRRVGVIALVAAALIANANVAVSAARDDVPRREVRRPSKEFSVSTVSTRAEMVTAGDVLVQVDVPRTVPIHRVRVSVDGRDVSEAFAPEPGGGRTLLGLVDGLPLGESTIKVRATGRGKGRPTAKLTVVNHPISGPVFSGPHQQPFLCQTESFGLGPALDDDCSAATIVEYVYRTTGGTFEPFDPTAAPPTDLAQTTTTEGDTVDYIVRVETGTINRAVYQIAMLHQPGTALPDPWTSTPGWNGRLVYTFGGNCDAGFRQGSSTGGVLDDGLLSPGFAVASASLNVFGNDCNDVISAETAMMVKEHFIESFGRDRATIGFGCSGGSMQVHLIGQNYPGILDGIVPMCSYPDIMTIITPVQDCLLILNAVDQSQQAWTLEQLSAVTGFANDGTIETCTLWAPVLAFAPGWVAPEVPIFSAGCHQAVPDDLEYDPVTNPDGVRCTVYDTTVNVFGRDPVTGFARRPLDNTGVQYGLEAFNDGIINFEQFAELNEFAGGYDDDGNLVVERTVANPDALAIAYQTGRVNSGGGGLAEMPIIDVRGYTDTAIDIHDRFRSFSTRQRLIASNGHADNHVIWTSDATTAIVGVPHNYEAVRLVDEWLAAIAADSDRGTLAEKVVRNKPADAVDTCWTPSGDKVVEPATFDGPGRCNELYPNHADPRLVAGAPVANDVLKCSLKAIDPGDYEQPLTDPQLDRLAAAFPNGVCDFTVPGLGQQPLTGTWLDY